MSFQLNHHFIWIGFHTLSTIWFYIWVPKTFEWLKCQGAVCVCHFYCSIIEGGGGEGKEISGVLHNTNGWWNVSCHQETGKAFPLLLHTVEGCLIFLTKIGSKQWLTVQSLTSKFTGTLKAAAFLIRHLFKKRERQRRRELGEAFKMFPVASCLWTGFGFLFYF